MDPGVLCFRLWTSVCVLSTVGQSTTSPRPRPAQYQACAEKGVRPCAARIKLSSTLALHAQRDIGLAQAGMGIRNIYG